MATDCEKPATAMSTKPAETCHLENQDVENFSSTGPDEKILKFSQDVDEAMKAFADVDGEPLVLTEETNKRLLRIIDWHLMPLMCVIYGLNYLDKTTLSYASVMGLKKDTNLKGDNYQWLGSMFYFGYLAWEWPTTRLLQRLPLAKYSAFCMVAWGSVLTCFAAVQNFSGAVALRFFLGVFEAAVTPGFALLTSQWYTKREQAIRVNLWFSFNGWAQVFGAVLAYGIAVGSRIYGTSIAPWKTLFITTGLLTVSLGVLFWWFIPDNQLNARWLSKKDRTLAVERVRVNQQGIGNKQFKMYQLKEALTDPISWAIVFYGISSSIPNGGISNFFSQLIVSFGYTPEQSLLYGAPGGAVQVISLFFNAVGVAYFQRRLIIATSGLYVGIIGVILMVALPASNNIGRLVGYCLTQAVTTGFVCILALISSNIAGYTKKTTVAAMFLMGYCTGNIIGPQTFRPENAPDYTPAKITILVCWSLCIFDLYFMRWWFWRQNAKKARVRAEPGYVKLPDQE
ncbi:Allantoate permease [Emydomyces testavorans]|uniref:Allantoate permease n=1 Tax=Emydomyces testavorans TaxID=2070801 RepID=A0AAF0DGM1_9EURO|nr:Allantoate permease [Emydomyces testavorans]